jgi:hypothetical protein
MIERFVCPFMPPAHCLFHCPFLLRYPIPTPTLPLKGREGAEPGQGESASTAMMSQADRGRRLAFATWSASVMAYGATRKSGADSTTRSPSVPALSRPSSSTSARRTFTNAAPMLGVDPQPPPTTPTATASSAARRAPAPGMAGRTCGSAGTSAGRTRAPAAICRRRPRQLMTYALALDNPPLLVVSNRAITQIHTHFTGTPSETLHDPPRGHRHAGEPAALRWLFTDPEKFRPGRTVLDITGRRRPLCRHRPIDDRAWPRPRRRSRTS